MRRNALLGLHILSMLTVYVLAPLSIAVWWSVYSRRRVARDRWAMAGFHSIVLLSWLRSVSTLNGWIS